METHRIIDLANMISEMTGVPIARTNNPRNEAPENELSMKNENFLKLGLNPIKLSKGLLVEIEEVAKKYADRVDKERIPCMSTWTRNLKAGLPEQANQPG